MIRLLLIAPGWIGLSKLLTWALHGKAKQLWFSTLDLVSAVSFARVLVHELESEIDGIMHALEVFFTLILSHSIFSFIKNPYFPSFASSSNALSGLDI